MRSSTKALLLAVLATPAACGGEIENSPPELVGPRNLTPVAVEGPFVVERTVYVPIYSSLYVSDLARPVDLVATVSLRNVSETVPVVLTRADYYDSDGRRIREFVQSPQQLGPMMTAEFIIPRTDRSGGSGANFLVHWGAQEPSPELLVEAVMDGRNGNAGISFTSRGQVVVPLSH